MRDGGGDGCKVSIGLNGRGGKLNAPTVFNAAYNIAQFWCGIAGIQVLKGKFPNLLVITISGGWAELDPDDAIAAAQKIGADAGAKKPISAIEFDAALKQIGRGAPVTSF